MELYGAQHVNSLTNNIPKTNLTSKEHFQSYPKHFFMLFQLGDRLVPDIWIHLPSTVSAHIVRSMILSQEKRKS